MLAALECVSGIFIFINQPLSRELEIFHPDIYVKSMDYNLETLNAEEYLVLQKIGTDVKFVQTLPHYSTTALVEKIQNMTPKMNHCS
jgi:bifunctional ADP-heptose synthase (sugar kinase/adenylyltransferase)